MGHQLDNSQNHSVDIQDSKSLKLRVQDDFVLEKSIFKNVFEKDIRRVFVYKKAERLAKALHLIIPAFVATPTLQRRFEAVAIGLVDSAVLPPRSARTTLARELLTLSSLLALAKTGGYVSSMNVALIAGEAQSLLQEVAAYEDPMLALEESPTLSSIAKQVANARPLETRDTFVKKSGRRNVLIKDIKQNKRTNMSRRDTIVSVIRSKGRASIKDISTLFHDVSEKTIQRELLALVTDGVLIKEGERRWSTYSLAQL